MLMIVSINSRLFSSGFYSHSSAKDEGIECGHWPSPAVGKKGFAKVGAKSCSGISFKSQALYLIVYITRYLGESLESAESITTESLLCRADIFWTLTTGTLYNITFKLLFLAASSYTVYLMVNDYKPTHDPNIDTFKVQYLFGGSAVLAILFPYRYEITEVGYISTHQASTLVHKLTLGPHL